MKREIGLLALIVTFIFAATAFAYVVPREDSRVKFFYIFGPSGDADLGAEESRQEFFIDVPQDGSGTVNISIFDPETGGKSDLKPSLQQDWDTVTEFAVYGKNNELLESKEFAESKEYDHKYYSFGPYVKEQGELNKDNFRFKLVVRAMKGKDENLYYLRILPEDSEVFSYNFTFRLLEKEGDKMYFYPLIPGNTEDLIVYNYDMDPNGGTCELYDPEFKERYKINNSASGKQADTRVRITRADHPRRLEYIVTKKTQKYGNAGISLTDANGNKLPIYFKQMKPILKIAPAPLPQIKEDDYSLKKCNDTFIFDATKSYDPRNGKLTYNWDFGDGLRSTEPVVTHTYKEAGEYTVKLSVRNDSGLECDNSEVINKVKVNAAPLADFSAPDYVCPGSEVVFDASLTKDNTRDQLTYRWDFGDGTSGTGERAYKTYKTSGLYKVRLTADDNEGTPCSLHYKEKIVSVVASPLADAGDDIESCLAFDKEYRVSFSAGRNKSQDTGKMVYHWDFGDGNTASGRSVTHIYQKGGSYTVKLKVDNGLGLACSSSTDTALVTLSKRPVAKAGEDQLICIGSETFFDGSGSFSENNSNLEYTWDFGDQTEKARGAKVSHIYKKAGNYNVSLTVDDGRAGKCSIATDSVAVEVKSPPKANLKGVNPVCTNSQVNFDASGSSGFDKGKLKYKWDFGDGTSLEAGAKVSHTYTKGGEYNVSVIVSDGSKVCAFDTATAKVQVNSAPIANPGPNLVCCVNKQNTFDASGSYDPEGDPLTYLWDFGDGSSSHGVKVNHKYNKPGVYTVTLTVKDNSSVSCNSAVTSFIVNVNDNPVSIMQIKKH